MSLFGTTTTPSTRTGPHPVRQRRGDGTAPGRFRLHRAGILNVWQYDDQEFHLAGGRMLLRGANGAGKSKTLEMLLPFALDGDKARITASARHHTSLLWLMTDGYDGQARTGYVWVEFARPGAGGEETYTCGVGIRASSTAKTATAWFFATDQRVGRDLLLEDDGGPLSRPGLAERIGEHGQVFEQARAYKEHVGRTLFGLDVEQYDDVLRLLYWLRQPQVGEDIEPARLAGQLAQALPQLDEQAVRAAGDTFDELAAFGDSIDRRSAAAEALAGLASAYARYAKGVAAARGSALLIAAKEERRRLNALRQRQREQEQLLDSRQQVATEARQAEEARSQDRARLRELEASPQARDQRRLGELADRAAERDRAAEGAASRAATLHSAHERRSRVLTDDAVEIARRLQSHASSTRAIGAGLRNDGVDQVLAFPAALDAGRLELATQAERITTALDGHGDRVDQVAAALRRRQAAVLVVRQALDQLADAVRDSRHEERRAADTDRRADESRRRWTEAQSEADQQETRLLEALRAWAAHPAAPPVVLPGELAPAELDRLPTVAAVAAEPALTDLRGREQQAVLARDRAESEVKELTARRGEIEQERDPGPPPPQLPRTARADGAAFWRLVDFAPSLPPEERAGLEAALQASGVLDAWVRPDGALLDLDNRDVVLPLPPGSVEEAALAEPYGVEATPCLGDVLVPDCPVPTDVRADVVAGLLRRIGLGSHRGAAASRDVAGQATGNRAWLALDGSWALGPLRGRASKERAQYVGATARAQERRRRLEEVDRALAEARRRYDEAASGIPELTQRIAAIQRWVRDVPPTQSLLRARARLEERATTAAQDESANAEAQRAASAARERVAALRKQAHQLAVLSQLPADPGALSALAERLEAASDDLADLRRDVPALTRDLTRWAQQRTELEVDAEAVRRSLAESTGARRLADQAAAALTELRASVGASVRQLQERVEALERSIQARGRAADAAGRRLSELDRKLGQVDADLAHAQAAVEEHREVRASALRGLAELAEVPGLLESAFAPDAAAGESGSAAGDGFGQAPEASVLLAAGGLDQRDAVPRDLVTAAESMTRLTSGDEQADGNMVWRAYNEASSGPAADHEPRVLTIGELLAVTGRDEAGESAVAVLAPRIAAAVQRDRELLTRRERERFEQHVLGELGDAIRRCRVEAEELVQAMNDLLATVTTSQGIRVRLDWRLRDDVPAEAKQAVRLLTSPVGALLPEERAALRDSLHRLIEASRAERPELAYAENLASALDYRTWFAFRIRYTRPESDGAWLDLHRRSPLSQGEQKVLCYLPLFAAAAAHFTSLAGAAPSAPRLVLLDDAFPKIDVRTHPLLFGLLVQLDLDFVITSERLWGDHETVPSLAIYEALRDPSQRGIAQYQYRWDGRQLRPIG